MLLSSISVAVGCVKDGIRFNQPINRIPSAKAALGRLRKLVKSEPVEWHSVIVSGDFWENIKNAAQSWELSVGDFLLVAVDYHAALWREKQAKERPMNPAARFEKALTKEYRATKQVSP